MVAIPELEVIQPYIVLDTDDPNEEPILTRISEIVTGDPAKDTGSIINYRLTHRQNEWPQADIGLGLHFRGNKDGLVQPVDRKITNTASEYLNLLFSTRRSPLVIVSVGMSHDPDVRLVLKGKVTRTGVSGQVGGMLRASLTLQHQYSELEFMDLSWMSETRDDYVTGDPINLSALEKRGREHPDTHPGAAAWMDLENGEDDKYMSLAALMWAAMEMRYHEAVGIFTTDLDPFSPPTTAEEFIQVGFGGQHHAFIYKYYPLLRNILEASVPHTKALWHTELGKPWSDNVLEQLVESDNPWAVIKAIFNDFGYQLICPTLWNRNVPDAGTLVPYFALEDVFHPAKDPLSVNTRSDVYIGTPYGGIPVRQIVARDREPYNYYIRDVFNSTKHSLSNNPGGTDDMYRYKNMVQVGKAAGGGLVPGLAAWPPLGMLNTELLNGISRIMVVDAPSYWNFSFSRSALTTAYQNVPTAWIYEGGEDETPAMLQAIEDLLKKIPETDTFKTADKYREALRQLKQVLEKQEETSVLQPADSLARTQSDLYHQYKAQRWLRLYAFLYYTRHVLRQYSAGPLLGAATASSFTALPGLRYYVTGGKGRESDETLFSGMLREVVHAFHFTKDQLSFTSSLMFNHVLGENTYTEEADHIRSFLKTLPSLQQIFEDGVIPDKFDADGMVPDPPDGLTDVNDASATGLRVPPVDVDHLQYMKDKGILYPPTPGNSGAGLIG